MMDEFGIAKSLIIDEEDLPVFCPPKNSEQWQLHPRVFLPLNKINREANCPYCGMHYHLRNS